jgi:hypothetical protein
LLHRGGILAKERDPKQSSVHGRGFELPCQRLPDDLLGLIEAIETGEGARQKRVAGSGIRIEANRLEPLPPLPIGQFGI